MSFYGVEVNHAEKRFEWVPGELQDNLYRIIGSLQRDLEIGAEGTPYLLPDGKTFAINFKSKKEDERQ